MWGALREHFVDRGIHGMHHKQPPWYFLTTLPPVMMPWTALVPGALVLAWRRRRLPADRFLLVAALFVVAFFSISTEKRELYALPAMPAFALMTAALVGKLAGWREPPLDVTPAPSRRWVSVAQAIVGVLLALVGLAVPLVAADRVEHLPAALAWLFGALLLAAGVATLWLVRRRSILGAALAPAAGVAVAYLLVATAVYPLFEERKSSRPFALRIAEVTADSRAAGLPVVAYDLGNLPEPFAFYSDGVYTVETNDPEKLRRHLERPEQVFAVVNGDRLEPLSEALRARLRVIDETRLSRRRVLLVTNRDHPEGRPVGFPGRVRQRSCRCAARAHLVRLPIPSAIPGERGDDVRRTDENLRGRAAQRHGPRGKDPVAFGFVDHFPKIFSSVVSIDVASSGSMRIHTCPNGPSLNRNSTSRLAPRISSPEQFTWVCSSNGAAISSV